MEKLPLFLNKKEMFIATFIVALLLLLSYSYEYSKFLHVKKIPTFSVQAKVVDIYEKVSKKGKKYQVLKLKSDDFKFYTIRWKPLDVEKQSLVRVVFYTKNIDFKSYLKGFFAPHKSLKILKKADKDFLHVKVEKQHESAKMQELFAALFFATPYSKELRYEINKWGISHLVAISGFHLGMLSAILFFFLKPIYSYFQDKFFPYQNAHATLAFIVFLLLGFYVYYIDFVPSVVRAYTMSVVGFFIFSKNIKLISFSTLFITVGLVLIFFPKLLFSIAFYFSVMGVFYIFLFLHHFSHLKNWLIFVLLNFWVYFVMLPIIHNIFELFTYYQLLSPFISMAFTLFYPLELFLHFINQGGLFDRYLTQFLELDMRVLFLHVNLYELIIYLAFSLLAIRYKLIALLLPLIVLAIFFI